MNHPIPQADKVPLKTKTLMGAGGGTEFLATNLTTQTLWMPFFNLGLGVSPVLLGSLLLVFRIWDAISDPLMGHLTDNTRSRWGRRRPWIVGGAVALALCVLLLFRADADWGESTILVYLLVVGLLLFTASTVWGMPFHSLLMELTPNYDERTRLASVSAFFGKIFGLLGGWVLAIASSSWFANPETGEADLVRGIQFVSYFIAGAVLVFGVLPGLFVRERFHEQNASRPKEAFWKNFKETLSNRPLWLLNGIVFFNLLGLISTAAVGQYVNIFYVSQGSVADASWIEGWKQTAMFAVGILSLPVWVKLSERFDKKITLSFILVGTLVGQLLNFVCLNQAYPYLQIIPSIFWSGVASAIWLLVPSMKMDIADQDEWVTGRRREGSLNSVLSWCIKMAIALGVGSSGLILEATGFDAKLAGPQPPEVLRNLVLAYILVPFVLWLPTFYFLWRYPLNRKVMEEIRGSLEARRGKV